MDSDRSKDGVTFDDGAATPGAEAQAVSEPVEQVTEEVREDVKVEDVRLQPEGAEVEETEPHTEEAEVEEAESRAEEAKTTSREQGDKKAEKKKLSKKQKIAIVAAVVLLVLGVGGGVAFALLNKKDEPTGEESTDDNTVAVSQEEFPETPGEDFDLAFLQFENEPVNKVYSPLSIKYALGMLRLGAAGETQNQISRVIGSYVPKKYANNANMSFANALFINNAIENSIKSSYITEVTSQFNAEVIYDPFTSPVAMNNWISGKTFGLLDNVVDDVADHNFVLINALAIDMEWVNKIQSITDPYNVKFPHISYKKWLDPLWMDEKTGLPEYHELEFNGTLSKVNSLTIAAVANKYDIVNDLGDAEIRKLVGDEYETWLTGDICGEKLEDQPDTKTFLDKYMEELGASYKFIKGSTDFYFYDDADIKMFAKDLREYDGTTLQYVGIMPKNAALTDYVKDISGSKINSTLAKLKPIELDSFKEGVITEIFGYIPVFHFNYSLNLVDDLGKLGITDVFDAEKADLSDLSSEQLFVDKAAHKANIEFSNDGIKAAGTAAIGGFGATGCGFDHIFDAPVEKIDLTFDKPYMFLIRDKENGEVWFVGTVYQPEE